MTTEKGKQITCDISDILKNFGKFQAFQYLLMCLSIMVVSICNINYVFVVGDLKYRCRVNECEDANSTAHHPSWWPDTNIDRCSAPVLKSGEQVCTNDSFTGELTTCGHWIYESNDTVVAELNLACQPWKSSLIGSIHSAGWLIAFPLFGWIADKIGRKPVLIFNVVTGCIGYFKTFASSYYMYIAIEFLEALGTGGHYSAAMVLLLEISSKKHRPMSGFIFTCSIYLGENLFAIIAMYVSHWKTIVAIIYGPCIFFISYIFMINESPRWQIVNGKIKEAKKTIKRIAIINKVPINFVELDKIDEAEIKNKFNIGRQEAKEKFADIFRTKEIVKRLVVACICRFSNTFVFFGMTINAVLLPGNKHLNFLLTTLMSFPGQLLALYLVYKVGRKIPLIVSFLLCGILCICSAVVPANYPWLKLSFFFIAKILISGCFSTLVTYTMELFPTSIRGTFVGVVGIFTRLASMTAALTPLTNSVLDGLPLLLFGSTSIISALLLLLTPETKSMPLFDTIEQIVNYRKKDLTATTETANE